MDCYNYEPALTKQIREPPDAIVPPLDIDARFVVCMHLYLAAGVGASSLHDGSCRCVYKLYPGRVNPRVELNR